MKRIIRELISSIPGITLLVTVCLCVVLLALTCAHAATIPANPTFLTARAGPGRTLTWDMGWDRAAGYGADSVSVNIWRMDAAGNQSAWRNGQLPRNIGCYIASGRYARCIQAAGRTCLKWESLPRTRSIVPTRSA